MRIRWTNKGIKNHNQFNLKLIYVYLRASLTERRIIIKPTETHKYIKIEKRKKTQHKTQYKRHVTFAGQILFGKLLTPLAGESNYAASKNIGAVAAMFRVTTATEGNSTVRKHVSRPNHGTANATHQKFQSFFYPPPGYKPSIFFIKWFLIISPCINLYSLPINMGTTCYVLQHVQL